MAAPFGPPPVVAKSDFSPPGVTLVRQPAAISTTRMSPFGSSSGPSGKRRPEVTTRKSRVISSRELAGSYPNSPPSTTPLPVASDAPAWAAHRSSPVQTGRGDARVLLVGEAPGRLGAGRTGVPFSGDASGDRFERLLEATGLSRGEVFVTNAALCLPLDARGRNRPPRPSEIANCTQWLRATVAMLQPSLVVGMGAVALRALSHIEAHTLTLSAAGQAPVGWNGRYLTTTYHPAARAQIHRPLSAQFEDWRHIGAWIRANLGG